MTVVAVVTDLMDRSRLEGIADRFVRRLAPADVDARDVVVIDLAVPGAFDSLEAAHDSGAQVVAYGSHVDTDTLDAARHRGASVLPRSRFFHDPAAAVAGFASGR